MAARAWSHPLARNLRQPKAVLRLDLPIDADLMVAMRRFLTADFLAQYPQTAGPEYLQGRGGPGT